MVKADEVVFNADGSVATVPVVKILDCDQNADNMICKSCSSSEQCEECAIGYRLDGRLCKACDTELCAVCDDLSGRCN